MTKWVPPPQRRARNKQTWAMLTALRDQAWRAAKGEPGPDDVTDATWATLKAAATATKADMVTLPDINAGLVAAMAKLLAGKPDGKG